MPIVMRTVNSSGPNVAVRSHLKVINIFRCNLCLPLCPLSPLRKNVPSVTARLSLRTLPRPRAVTISVLVLVAHALQENTNCPMCREQLAPPNEKVYTRSERLNGQDAAFQEGHEGSEEGYNDG